MKEGIRRRISDVLDLPPDIILNVPRVVITGKIAVFVENHKGIIEYNSQLVKINTPIGVVCVKGQDLLIKTIISDEITIEGQIKVIEFEE
ncbi:MAG: sporulation protein YqfC [Tepidanaerobacteraceae bacterium]|jgi:sporulation protein YqfC|nr:sporulation protein YqfC [Thermoanaerobacterales bacterium]